MLRVLFLLMFSVGYGSCADRTVFKNCTETPFCNILRNSLASDPFIADLKGIDQQSDIVSVPISNSNGNKFLLQVSLFSNLIGRVKILEEQSKRYELVDVLDGEPDKLELETTVSDQTIAIKTKNANDTHKVVITANPLTVKFYLNDDILLSTVKPDRLILKKDIPEFTFGVEFNEAIRLYGLHHHALNLELAATKNDDGYISDPIRLRNSDNAYYEVDSPMALYGAAPVVYGHSEKQTSGIFLHNAAEQWIDITYDSGKASADFIVAGGVLDLFVFFGPTPPQVVRQITQLTGVPHMPQLWTLGYHQSRWSYFTQEDVKEVVAQMDVHKFPIDAMWLDIDYTNGYRYFTWNSVNYTDPIELQSNLSSTGRKLVVISDPHIKVDENYDVYAQAKGKYFVRWANGSDFQGDCWPGLSSYLDFLNPEARDFYASLYSYDYFKGSTPTLAGIWNDMNEPSVFNEGYEKTFPYELTHYGNVSHRDIHNIYGFLQTKATHHGLMQRDKGTKRPFVLTRSHFVGTQRYAAMWTGDNTADWPFLKVSYSECLGSNLIGLAFCGADVGGFFYDPEVELVQRWYQAAAWTPFYRGHSHMDTKRREPYLYEDSVQDVIRNAIIRRYQHIPEWYTLFYEHVRTGNPVIRPLFYEYPGTVDKNDHLLLGSNILARPVLEKGVDSVSVTFPGTSNISWYRIDDGSQELFAGGTEANLPVNISTSPYFYKGGSIVSRQDDFRSTTNDSIFHPYTLYVNVNNKIAYGVLYLDDYTSFEYQNGQFALYQFQYYEVPDKLVVQKLEGDGTFELIIEAVVVNSKVSTDKYKRTVHNHLADGTLLRDFNKYPGTSADKTVVLKF